MLNEKKISAFREWLSVHYSHKVVGDIISRLNRVDKLCKIEQVSAPDEFLLKLNRNKSFAALSMFVKSQLRKSYKLFAEFNAPQR